MNNQEAIKILKMQRYEMGLPNQGSTWKANADTIALDLAITALEAQKDDMWIPISSGRMPEPYKNVLAWVDDDGIECFDLCCVDDKGKIVSFDITKSNDSKRLMAWRELPTPWKEEQK